MLTKESLSLVLIVSTFCLALTSCHSNKVRSYEGDYYLLKPPADTTYIIEPTDSLGELEKSAMGIWHSYSIISMFVPFQDKSICYSIQHRYYFNDTIDSLVVLDMDTLTLIDGKYWEPELPPNLDNRVRTPRLYYMIEDNTLSVYSENGGKRYSKEPIRFLKQPYIEEIAREIEKHRHHVIAFRGIAGSILKIYWEGGELYMKFTGLEGEKVLAIPHDKGIEIVMKPERGKEVRGYFTNLVLDTSLTKVYFIWDPSEDWREVEALPDPEFKLPGAYLLMK